MTGIRISRQVEAPIEVVFARASDFENAAEMVEAIDKVEILTDPPVGVGTRFLETRTVFGRSATEEMEVTAFEPPRRYVLEAESHGAHYRSELLFEEKDGGTEVTMTFEARPLSFFAKLTSFLMKPMMKKMMAECARDLDDLKRAIESAA